MVKEIQLTQNKVTLVDDEDYEFLNQWKWYADYSKKRWTARRDYLLYGRKKHIHMHREIMNTPDGMETDHINHDTLDNRRCNLRICTHSQNTCNCIKKEHQSSPFKGVRWSKVAKKWEAQIKSNHKNISLGYFDKEIEAARAYDKAALKYHGEFANLNFKDQQVASAAVKEFAEQVCTYLKDALRIVSLTTEETVHNHIRAMAEGGK